MTVSRPCRAPMVGLNWVFQATLAACYKKSVLYLNIPVFSLGYGEILCFISFFVFCGLLQ